MPIEARDNEGRFTESPESLGKTIGLRIRKDLEPKLEAIAKEKGVSKTMWCREVVEKAIAEILESKAKAKKEAKGKK